MITLYGHSTPNVYKITIALEELEFAYDYKQIDIFAGENQTPEYLKISPAGKVPAISDDETGTTVFESNAILIYLAEKAGRLLPPIERRTELLELLFLQASLQGPMFGQRAHFSMFAPETVPYGIHRYEEQSRVFDQTFARLLDGKDYLMGDFSIADITFFGWYFSSTRSGFFDDVPDRVKQWYGRIAERPGVMRGIERLPSFELPPRRIVA